MIVIATSGILPEQERLTFLFRPAYRIARKEVLEGLLGADLIGFQTYSFARHFLQTCSRILSVESNPKGIQLENTAVNIGIFPIGKRNAFIYDNLKFTACLHVDRSVILTCFFFLIFL